MNDKFSMDYSSSNEFRTVKHCIGRWFWVKYTFLFFFYCFRITIFSIISLYSRFRFTTDFLLCSLQIGFCCVYIVFIANNLQAAVGKLDVRVWMIVLLPFIIAPSLISDIRRLAYLTTAGNIIILIGLGVIYEYILTHINYKKDIHILPATTNFLETCVSFGQIVYAFEGIAVVSWLVVQ